MFLNTIHSLSVEDVYNELDTSPGGLSSGDVLTRQVLYGKNQLHTSQSPSNLRKFLIQVTHPFAILLWIASLLAFLSLDWALGCIMCVLVLVNAWFSYQREYRAEQAMSELQEIIPNYARVIRDNAESYINSKEIVPGDVLILAEGDQIPADARIIESFGLRTSNAILLGESIPARKTADASLAEELSELERPNLVFAGTSVVSGTGRAIVFATGMLTQFGKVAHLTQTVTDTPSSLQKELNQFTRLMLLIALFLGAIIFFIGIFEIGFQLSQAFLLFLGVIVALVPEGLSANVTLSLALAGQRLARQGVLVKKLSVIDSLATLSVICTDKSGTLTQNEMTVREIWVAGKKIKVSGIGYSPIGEYRPTSELANIQPELRLLLTSAMLCNNSKLCAPTPTRPDWNFLGDQTEVALRVAALKGKVDEIGILTKFPRIHELPFDARRKRMTTIHRMESNHQINKPGDPFVLSKDHTQIAFVKGAPKEILSLCTKIYIDGKICNLDLNLRQQILAAQDTYAHQALRILAFGYRTLPVHRGQFLTETIEQDLVFLGLMAMQDPPRPQVEEAIRACKQAGIRIIILTGDYGLTAEALARKVGILGKGTPQIITGAELETLSEDQLQRILPKEVIFARMAPEHKMRLVDAFQKLGEIVAVTGDGVNDAPALRKANIGIAMGKSGTSVAREAADIILTDDNFAHLINAIEEGRTVYNNIRKFITYIFSSNVPEVLPYLITALFNLPLALSIKQVLAIDLLTDMLPGMALGAEKPEPNMLNFPPRNAKQHLIDKSLIRRSFFWLGLIETGLAYTGVFLVYQLFNPEFIGFIEKIPLLRSFISQVSLDPNDLQNLAMTVFFTGVVMAQIGNLFSCRAEYQTGRTIGWFRNPILVAACIGVAIILLSLIYLQPLAKIFNHVPIPPIVWVWLVFYPIILYGLEKIRKNIFRTKNRMVISEKAIYVSSKAKEIKEYL